MRPKTPHLFVVEDRGYETPCHVWTRALNSCGYGVRKVGDRIVLAHRHAYEETVGPIPDGKQIDHLCRVRACVNVSHLEPVSQAENLRRGAKAKLTLPEVVEIRRRRQAGESTVALAAEFGVADASISRIARGLRWKDAA